MIEFIHDYLTSNTLCSSALDFFFFLFIKMFFFQRRLKSAVGSNITCYDVLHQLIVNILLLRIRGKQKSNS